MDGTRCGDTEHSDNHHLHGLVENSVSLDANARSPSGHEDDPITPVNGAGETATQCLSHSGQDRVPDNCTPYSAFSAWEKRLITLVGAISALISSWTAQIYLPSLPLAAKDLGVNTSQINLTVTVYMVFQGITPVFVGSVSDVVGRRPVFLACFFLYAISNVTIALTDGYGSLLGLRCFQSIAVSASQSLFQGVIADISTSAERGQYAVFLTLPLVLGPSVGPLIGGAIATSFGWRNVFWFLTAIALLNLASLLTFLSETCRNVVGNGSIAPSRANQSIWQIIRDARRSRQMTAADQETGHGKGPPVPSAMELESSRQQPKRHPTTFRIFSSLALLSEKELGLLFLYSGLLFAGVSAIGTAFPTKLASIYGFNPFHVGLMYLPMAAGSIFGAVMVGPALNWNYRRHAQRLGFPLDRAQQLDLGNFPIEEARLQVVIPWLVLGLGIILSWGWALEKKAPIAVVCILVFLFGLGLAGTNNVLSALIVDVRPTKAAAAAAANNTIKFFLGAGMSAAIEPLIVHVGLGKAYTIIAALYVLLVPCLFQVWKNGMRWRRDIRDAERQATST